MDSTTMVASEYSTLHPDDMPKEEVQTHAPPAIESLEKMTESPAEKTTLPSELEKMTDRPEDETKDEVFVTTVPKDEDEKMTESPMEKTTLTEDKEEPLTDKPTAEKESTTMMPEKDEVTTVGIEKDDEVKADKDEPTDKDQLATSLRPEIDSDEKMTEQPKLDQTTLIPDEKRDDKPEEQESQTTVRPTVDIKDRLDTIPKTPEKEDATIKPEMDELAKTTTALPSEAESTDKTEIKPDTTDAPKEDATIKPEMDESEKATTALPSEADSTDRSEMKPDSTEAPKEEEEPVGWKLDGAKPTEAPVEMSTQKDEEETHKPPVIPDVDAHETTMKAQEPEATTHISEPSDYSTTLRSDLPITTESVTEADEEAGFTTTKITLAPAKGHKKPVTEMIDGTMVEIVTPSSEIKTEAPIPYEIVTPLSVGHEVAGTTLSNVEEEESSKTTVAPEESRKDEPEQTTEMIDQDKQTTLQPESEEALDKDSTSRPDEEKPQDKLTTLRPEQESEEQTTIPAHEDDLMDKQTTIRPEEETKAEHDYTTLSSEPAKVDEQEKATTPQPSEDHTEAPLDKDDDIKVTTVIPDITEAPKHDIVPETEASMTDSPKDDSTDKPKQDDEQEMTEKPTTESEEVSTEHPKLPAPEEIETKTELPYGLVTERLPEELTTILAQSGLDLTTMRIEYDHTMEPEKDTHTTAKPDESDVVTDAPRHEIDEHTDAFTEKGEMVTEGAKLPSEDMAESTTLASKPDEDIERMSTVAPHEEDATEKDTVKAEKPESMTEKPMEATTVEVEDDETEISKTTLAPEHELHEDTMRPHVDATTVKPDDESKSDVEDKTTMAPMHEDAGLDKTTLQPEGIDTKFGEESDKDEERHDELPTATTIHPTILEEDSHEEDVQRPVDSSEPHYPSYPEEHTAKPPQPTYGTPAAPGFDPSTFGQMPSGYPSSPDSYDDYEDTESDPSLFGPGTCRYGGKLYVSAQQIPRDDPCDFCFCFRSDIICLQQSCPPPINGCHEETIEGFCCPR